MSLEESQKYLKILEDHLKNGTPLSVEQNESCLKALDIASGAVMFMEVGKKLEEHFINK